MTAATSSLRLSLVIALFLASVQTLMPSAEGRIGAFTLDGNQHSVVKCSPGDNGSDVSCDGEGSGSASIELGSSGDSDSRWGVTDGHVEANYSESGSADCEKDGSEVSCDGNRSVDAGATWYGSSDESDSSGNTVNANIHTSGSASCGKDSDGVDCSGDKHTQGKFFRG